MTDFQHDIVKILLDKVLLALVAMLFGFYLSRLLEGYRSKKSYHVFVWQQQIDACRKAVRLIIDQYEELMELHTLLEKMAAIYPNKLTKEEMMPGHRYAESYTHFKVELHALLPFLTSAIVDEMMRFLDYVGRVAVVLKGQKPEGGWPNKEELGRIYSELLHVCHMTVMKGPFSDIKPERLKHK